MERGSTVREHVPRLDHFSCTSLVCRFHEAMKHFTLSQSVPPYISSYFPISTPSTSPSSMFLSPPHSLLSYQPFEILTNALVAAFNNLRACTPLALAPEITKEVDRLLQSVLHDVGEYYRLVVATVNEYMYITYLIAFFIHCSSTLH